MSIEELESQIKALQEEIEKLKVAEKEPQSSRWKPREGEQYWCICDCGDIGLDRWVNDKTDNWRYNNSIVFECREEAEKYKKFREDVLAHSYEFSDEEWADCDICKYFIYYDFERSEKCLDFSCDYTDMDFNKIYFKTEKDAQYIIDTYSEELMERRSVCLCR